MLTKKKRLYAEAREGGLNMTKSAIAAGCPAKTANKAGSRYEKDSDVIKYREKLKSGHFHAKGDDELSSDAAPAPIQRPEPDPSASNESVAILMLRAQLHSDEERIVQGAAKALLDYELRLAALKGKKQAEGEAAEKAAKGKFASATPIPLRSVK